MKERIRVRSLTRNISGVEGCVGVPGWGLGWMTSMSIIHTDLHKPNNKLVNACWNTFGAWMSHGHTWIHKIHLGQATAFPLIVLSVINHGGYIQMSFCPKTFKLGVPKLLKLRLMALWRVIISCLGLWLKWSLKQNCSPRLDLSNDMWHIIFTQLFQGNSWLLVGRSQINTLTPILFSGHNLCFKYSNESYEPISDIYVSRNFQWYKEFFDPMSFDSWSTSLKIWDSIGIPTPKLGVHLGVCGFIPHTSRTTNVILKLHFRPAPFHAFALVASPKLRSDTKHLSQQELKLLKVQGGIFN
jgi:hypothetical protein